MMGATASESAYRVLMGVLESRTGQTLSPNRIWRIEMSLKPVMQRHGIADLDALVAALVTSNSRQLLDDTVDAMLNNETCFYREYSLFDDIAATVLEKLREVNDYRLLMFGLLLVVMMRFRPEGLIASKRRQLEFHEDDEELSELLQAEHLQEAK